MKLKSMNWPRWTPTVRLTTWYLAIIMAISLTFSVVQYRVASGEIGGGLRRQATTFEQLPGFFYNDQDVYNARDRQINDAQHRLAVSLILINLGILVAAGLSSYFLAKRTLQPIEDALEAQGRFASDASHELRTPLTAMKSEIEVTLRNGHLSEKDARELLASNLEEVAKLERLTNGLLKLARQDGKLPDEPVRFDDVAEEAVGRLSGLIKLRDINLDYSSAPLVVTGDKASLVELVVTLLDNAIKYSEKGATVTIKGEELGKLATLAISDNGLGIRAIDLPHIFDRFYRADTSRSKEQVDGYGLGLSIAKQIADMHGGAIVVRSTPGKGSTFSVQIPLRKTT